MTNTERELLRVITDRATTTAIAVSNTFGGNASVGINRNIGKELDKLNLQPAEKVRLFNDALDMVWGKH